MASNLKFGSKRDGYAVLDEFYKSLMFQYIMDGDFNRNERDILLVIFRKTVHFEKWEDRISMYALCKAVGISETTLRATLERLEEKCLINIKRSKGGKCVYSNKKYNAFSLHTYLINAVYQKWEETKLENGFNINYDF